MTTAVAYIRVSTQEQANGGVSLAAQEAQLRAYATAKGLDLVEVVVDAGVSGGSALSTRAGGRRVLDLVKRKKVSVVLATKLDRLFRSAADCLNTTNAWDKAGLSLHLLDLGLDTGSPMGRFFLTMLSGFAELEKNLVSERTKAALAHKKSEGQRVSGFAPFGYSFEEGAVVENNEEQAVVSQIKALAAAGYKAPSIAKALNSRGVPARGARWYGRSVYNVLEAAV